MNKSQITLYIYGTRSFAYYCDSSYVISSSLSQSDHIKLLLLINIFLIMTLNSLTFSAIETLAVFAIDCTSHSSLSTS